jgi:hypothetical protein
MIESDLEESQDEQIGDAVSTYMPVARQQYFSRIAPRQGYQSNLNTRDVINYPKRKSSIAEFISR